MRSNYEPINTKNCLTESYCHTQFTRKRLQKWKQAWWCFRWNSIHKRNSCKHIYITLLLFIEGNIYVIIAWLIKLYPREAFSIYLPSVIHGILNCTALERADVTERSATAKSAPPSFGPIMTSLIKPFQFPFSSGFPY